MAVITNFLTAVSAWFKSLEIIATITGWSKSWVNAIGGALAIVTLLYFGTPYAVKAFRATVAYVQSPSDRYVSAKQFDEWTSTNAVLMRAGANTINEMAKEIRELKEALRKHDARFPPPQKKQPQPSWFGLTQ